MKSSPTAASQVSAQSHGKKDLQMSASAAPFDYCADVEDLAAPWKEVDAEACHLQRGCTCKAASEFKGLRCCK